MNYLSLLTMTLLLSTPSAQALQVTRSPGWVVSYQDDSASEKSSEVAGHLELILIPANDETGLNPPIQVLNNGPAQSGLGSKKEDWQAAVFKTANSRRTIFPESERTFQSDGQWRYVVDFQTDMGSDAMLEATLMATIVDGQVYVFIFENRRDVFRKHLSAVKKVFAELRLMK